MLVPIVPLESTSSGQYLIVAFETRKQGVTPAEFMNFYDNTHVPLIKKQMGSAFPLTHARCYVQRQPGSVTGAPVVFIGDASAIDYDVIAIMTFSGEGHFHEFQAKYADPEIGGPIIAEETQFLDSSVLRVIGIESAHITS
jgi:hypothetical protein